MDLSLSLLGSVRVVLNGKPVTAFESNKVRALLAYLAVENGRHHQRSALAGLLWPDHPEEMARTNLRHILRQLRQTLSDSQTATPLLITSRQTIQLNPHSNFTLDVTRFQELLAECERCDHHVLSECLACMERNTQAAALYQGDFLADLSLQDSDLFEEWVVMQREQLHRQALEVFFMLASYHEANGDYEQARHYAWRQIELEPWREEAHRQLMRVLARSNQRTAALAQFERCRTILADELGVEPAPETIALYEQIRTGQLERVARKRPLTTKDSIQASSPASSAQNHYEDWGGAPGIPHFYGRQTELDTLRQWVIEDHCRLVAVLGMGGMGKTSLVVTAVKAVAEEFKFVFWRSLINAPPLTNFLNQALQFLSHDQIAQLPTSLNEQITLLFAHLRQHRCLLVLDNMESILEAGQAGQYRAGYEEYGRLIQHVAQSDHQSCLILTSRERPRGVARLEEDLTAVRSLLLDGLQAKAGQALLKTRGLTDDIHRLRAVVQRYSGNPLALKLVTRTIQELFDGNIAAFLSDEAPVFDDIRMVLDQQFRRLSPLEREILVWLAIEREGALLHDLAQNLVRPTARSDMLAALRDLQRRSLLERTDAGFALQNVVTEYVTDYLVEQICREIGEDEGLSFSDNLITLSWLNSYALMKAEAKEYIRQSQVRQILQPIANRLVAKLGRARLAEKLQHILVRLRTETPLAPGYAAGNLLNLLLHLEIDLSGFDFSHLAVWQAHLRQATLHNVNFKAADLSHSVFSEIFTSVRSLAVRPNGQLLAAGTEDAEIRFWWLANRQPDTVIKAYSRDIRALAFSPDGTLLASSGENRAIALWDMENQKVAALLHGHTNWVWSVAFSPDGKLLASGSADCTIRLWNVETSPSWHTPIPNNSRSPNNGEESPSQGTVLHGHTDWVCAVAFSPDGAMLASGSKDGTIGLWDLCAIPILQGTDAVEASGSGLNMLDPQNVLTARLHGHTHGVTTVAFSPDGSTLASGSEDHTVRLWDLQSQRTMHNLRGHTDVVTSVAFRPTAGDDGRFGPASLASGSRDGSVCVWDLDSGQLRHILHGHTSAVTGVAFTPDGNHVISGSLDQTVRIWNPLTGQALYTLCGHTNVFLSLAFSPNGKLLASGSSDQTVRLWDIEQKQIRHTLHGHSDRIKDVAFNADGSTLATSSLDQTIRTWDVESGQLLHTLPGHNNWVGVIIFTPDGQLLAGSSADESVHVRAPDSGLTLHTLRKHTSLVKSIAFSHDGHFLASGSWDQNVCVWDLRGHDSTNDTTPLYTLQGHESAIESLAFAAASPRSATRLLASGSWDQTVRVWEINNNPENSQESHSPRSNVHCRHILRGHTGAILDIAFTPVPHLIASASEDGTIRLWSVESGELYHVLRGHEQSVTTIAFTPDGKLLASGGWDQTIKLWDVETGVCLQTLTALGRYAGMNITGITGVSEGQRMALKALGAVEEPNGKSDGKSPLVEREPAAKESAARESLGMDKSISSPILYNFPVRVTSFVGRAAEVARIRDMLQSADSRLLTLVGVGGSGKTRLSIEVATAEASRFADGACFVGLAPLASSSLIASTIATVLDIVLSPTQDPESQVISWLRGKEMLLVLDNFEHLLDGAEFLLDLLQSAPGVVLIVTSRQALDLQAEVIYEVDGLAYPQIHPRASSNGSNESNIDPDPQTYAAIQLFQERAARVRTDFALSAETIPAVIRICQLVEGMPLGIELAATWVRTQSCDAIAQEIEHSLDFLATNRRDIAERHRSLRTVFEGSWNLLTKAEQGILAKLSLFRGQFNFRAAEAVAGARPISVAALVDKSLLRSDGQGRYDMHEIIRQYAAEKLAESPEEKVAAEHRYATYYGSHLQSLTEMIKDISEKQAMAEMDADIDNIRAAWRWTSENGDEAEIEKFLYSLHHFYTIKGWVQEGANAFAAAAQRIGGDLPESARSLTYWRMSMFEGSLLVELADFVHARRHLEASLSMLRRFDAPWDTAFCLSTLGKLAYRTGQYDEAKQCCQEAIDLYSTLGDGRGLAATVNILGLVNLDLGDYDESRRLHRENLARRRTHHDFYGLVYTMNNLGAVAHRLQEYEEAKQLYDEALALAQEIDYRSGVSLCLLNLGALINDQHEYSEALRISQQALAVTEEINDRRNVTWALTNLGNASRGLGDYAASANYLRQAVQLALAVHAEPRALAAIASIAALAAQMGDLERAVEFVALCVHHPASQKDVRARSAQFMAKLAEMLPPEVMDAAVERGKAQTLQEVAETL